LTLVLTLDLTLGLDQSQVKFGLDLVLDSSLSKTVPHPILLNEYLLSVSNDVSNA